MTDWAAHRTLGRRLSESLAWLLAAAMVLMLAATTAAIASWLDRRAGAGDADVVLIELEPLPVAQAFAEDPGPAPDVASSAPATPPPPPPEETTPQLQDSAEEAPDLTPVPDQPAPELAELVPQADVALPPPPEKPQPKPEKKPEPKQEPARKPAKKAETPKDQPKPEQTAKDSKSEAASAPAKAGAQTARGTAATASQMKKWQATVMRKLSGHMQRKTYKARGSVSVVFTVAASGQITGVALAQSSGNPDTDAAILAQARRAPALPAPPNGEGGKLLLQMTIKG